MKKSTRLNQRNKIERTLSAAVIATAMMTGASLAQVEIFDTNTTLGANINAIDGFVVTDGARVNSGGFQLNLPGTEFGFLESGSFAGVNLLTGNGTLVKVGGGYFTAHNSNNGFTGDVEIVSGVLRARYPRALGTGLSAIEVGTAGELELNLRAGANFTRDINNDGVLRFTDSLAGGAAVGNYEVSGDIDSWGVVIHDATTTTTISGALTELEDVIVNAGTLKVIVDQSINGDVYVANGAALDTTGVLIGANTTQIVDSISGEGLVNIGGGTLVTGFESSYFDGVINGIDGATGFGGTVIKDGDGVWQVDGAINLDGINGRGTVEVLDGVLALDGAAFADVFVDQDLLTDRFGILIGDGIIVGNVFNNGLVSPGSINSRVGQLDIVGDYIQGVDGNLGISLRSNQRRGVGYDHLAVDGVADLGGRLLVRTTGSYKPLVGDSYRIIEATGGVVGRFRRTRTSLDHTMLRLRPHYYNNHVVLRVEQIPFTSLRGLTHNQRQVARALDHASARGEIQSVFDYVNYTNRKNVPGMLSELSPEALTSIFTIGFATAQNQNFNIERRLSDVRDGAFGFSANGLAIVNDRGTLNYDGAPIANTRDGLTLAGWDGNTTLTKEVVAPVIEQNRWGFFATGTGEWVDVENTGNSRGFSFRNAGFTLGADYRVSENFVVGINAGYTNSSAKLPNSGSLDVDGGRGGVYASYFSGGAYLNAAASGGYNSYRSRRATLGGKAHGDTDGGEFNALLGGGYDFRTGGLTIGPVGSFQYTYIGINSFDETQSAAPLHIKAQHQESLRSFLGLKVAYALNAGSVVIKPEVRAQWKHEYMDAAASIDSRFIGGSTHFVVDGPDLGRDSLVLDAGASVEFNSSVSVFAYYTGELGRKNYEAHSVNGGFRVAF